jgi:acetyl-CoA carboxylase biotin carboxyl carrier protein
MDIEEIRRLVELMEERGVVELEVENRKGKLRLVRENNRAVLAPPVPERGPAPSHPEAAGPSLPAAGPSEVAVPSGGKLVTSPMVGTFYRSSGPDAQPYVDVGDVVEKGTVLCIIEAMKIMNEIEAEFPGRVVEILVENGHAVEYEQPLFVIEPLQA